MAAPQGIWSFPGMRHIMHGGFTNQFGTNPSSGTLYIVPQTEPIRLVGNLTLTYGKLRRVWRKALLDTIDGEIDDSGTEIWACTIKDRRWAWQWGSISVESILRHKRFNHTAHALADACLQALGETRYDIRLVPKDEYEASWYNASPREELQKILDHYNMRIFIDSLDRVRVVKLGVGLSLRSQTNTRQHRSGAGRKQQIKVRRPEEELVTAASVLADEPEIPPWIVGVCEPTMGQLDMELEAVGEEVKGQNAGKFVPINRLSYAPLGGWQVADIGNLKHLAKFPQLRKLAEEHVYKTYRIRLPIPVPSGPVRSGKQIQWFKNAQVKDLGLIELLDYQVWRQVNLQALRNAVALDAINVVANRRPAQVYGIWCDQQENVANVTVNVTPPGNPVPFVRNVQGQRSHDSIYTRSFKVDTARKLVLFQDRVYAVADATRGLEFVPPADDDPVANRRPAKATNVPALLYLRTAVRVRHAYELAQQPVQQVAKRLGAKDLGYLLRYEAAKRIKFANVANVPPLHIPVADQLELACIYPSARVQAHARARRPHQFVRLASNIKTVDKFVKAEIDQAAQALRVETIAREVRRYAGLVPIEMDGAIRQTTFWVDEEGWCRTQASWQTEVGPNPYLSTYEQGRTLERIDDLVALTPEVKRLLNANVRVR